jgi:hypothetical protein
MSYFKSDYEDWTRFQVHASSLSHDRFFCHFWGTASPTFESLRTTKYNFLVLLLFVYNGKFAVTTFKSRFSRCLNCLESFMRADFDLREKANLIESVEAKLSTRSKCEDLKSSPVRILRI